MKKSLLPSSHLHSAITPEEAIHFCSPAAAISSGRPLPAQDAVHMINLFIVKRMQEANHVSKVVTVF